MNSLFKEKLCNYCKNRECDGKIAVKNNGNLKSYKCFSYQKDSSKIIPYQDPILPLSQLEGRKQAER